MMKLIKQQMRELWPQTNQLNDSNLKTTLMPHLSNINGGMERGLAGVWSRVWVMTWVISLSLCISACSALQRVLAPDPDPLPGEREDINPQFTLERLQLDTAGAAGNVEKNAADAKSSTQRQPAKSGVQPVLSPDSAHVSAAGDFGIKQTHELKWRSNYVLPFLQAVAADEARIFLMDHYGQVIAYERTTDRRLWAALAAGGHPPLVSLMQDKRPYQHGAILLTTRGDKVITLLGDGTIKAFTSHDGQPLWTSRLVSPSRGPLLQLDDTRAALICADGSVVVIGLADGAIQWSSMASWGRNMGDAQLIAGAHLIPLAAADVAMMIEQEQENVENDRGNYSSSSDGKNASAADQKIETNYMLYQGARGTISLWRMDAASRMEEQWAVEEDKFTLRIGNPLPRYSSLVERSPDGRVMIYATMGMGALLAIDAGNQQIVWRHNFGIMQPISADTDGPALYFLSSDENLGAPASRVVAVDKRDGSLLWQVALSDLDLQLADSSSQKDRVQVQGGGNSSALARVGQWLRSRSDDGVREWIFGPQVIQGMVVLVEGRRGQLICLDRTNGMLLASYSLGGQVSEVQRLGASDELYIVKKRGTVSVATLIKSR